MKEFTHQRIAIRGLCMVVTCAVLAGCGGGGGSSPTPGGGPVAVQVSPAAFTMGVGSNYQFAATVTGTTNTAVSWEVNDTAGGSASVGTIDGTGLYIAPGNIPGEAITVKATAQANGTSSGTAAVTLTAVDQIGTGAGTLLSDTIPCPTVAGLKLGTCYSVSLSCPGISDLNGYLWVNTPPGIPVGTVMLTGGANSEGLYADPTVLTEGAIVVNGLLQANYITVQTSFGGVFTNNQPFGWQTGPGGLRRVACRYATLAKWVHDNVDPASAPLCATGTSAGAGLIGYAMAHYGASSLFAMVEPTSGPPFSRLDFSCECNKPDLPNPCPTSNPTLTQCVGLLNAQKYIDPAYSAPICSQAVQNQNTTHSAQFISDSILSPEATLNYANIPVDFVWGGMDGSSAPVMGREWQQLIKSNNTFACVADAPHNIADTVDGAQQILSDLVTSCH